MIQGILFDYDGTLSARYESAYHMYRHILQECRPDLDDQDIEFESIVQRCLYFVAVNSAAGLLPGHLDGLLLCALEAL